VSGADHPVDRPAVRRILASLPDARLVGGAVRDTLLGRAAADVDIATPAPPAEVMDRLAEAGLRVVPTGLAHGTVTAVTEAGPIEITTLRRDTETDGRHATVAFTDDWREDAARRDFTINAMSMAADATVFDYFDGQADLAAGRVRFVGDAAARIAEDYLRILRFFRFQARYGRGEPDAETRAALRDGVAGLGRLSPERVWSELKRILLAPEPGAAIALMHDLSVLPAVLPGADPAGLAALLALGAPPDALLLRLAALTGEATDTLAERLRLSNEEAATLAALRAAPAPSPDDTDDALRRLRADAPAAIAEGRTWLRQARDGGDPGRWTALRDRLAALPDPEFPLGGRDVVALGLPPGPAVGAALRAVRDWWLAGGCRADAPACRAELRRWLATGGQA
jgi:poly(A) polymerase/tRNA nucleotidyltransferase (CCA-adding enzyme)